MERDNTRNIENLEGEVAENEILRRILSHGFTENGDLPFDEGDVLGLKKGQRVSIAPTDFGFTHSDEGVLVGLSKNEVVIEVDLREKEGGKLRLHFPRIGFKVSAVEDT